MKNEKSAKPQVKEKNKILSPPNHQHPNSDKVPALRFPGFEGEWEEEKLGTVGRFIGGGTPSTKKSEYWQGTIPWVSSSDLKENDIDNINITRWITQEAIEESATKLIPQNSILIVSRVGVGKIAINNSELCTSQDFANLIPSKDDTRFLAYKLSNAIGQLLSFNQGTSIKGFVKADLEELSVALPSLKEQQKIASFLSSVDERLQQLQQRQGLLEQYKNGCMQQLFSQKVRFTNHKVKGYTDWTATTLGEIVESISNGTSALQVSEKTKFSVTRIETISKGIIDLSKVGFVKEFREIEEYKLLKGDLLFSNINSVAHIGKIALLTQNYNLYHGMNLLKIRFNTEIANPYYYYYLLGSSFYKRHFETICNQAVNQASINKTALKKTEILLPSLQEQTKIANFLSAIDEQINNVKEQIGQTQQFKKGLLQQLFV